MLKRLVAISATLACLSLAACGNEGDDDTATDTSSPSETSSETTTETPTESESAAAGSCEYLEEGSAPAVKEVDLPPSEPTATGQVKIVFKTTLGDIPATLDADATPCTVNSFISLAEQGFFDNSPCPRMATSPSFGILQCGDPSGTGSGGPGYSFGDELTGEETYGAGTLAMANTGSPDTNASQFFFVFNDSPGLTPNYNVFGTFDPAGLKLLTKAAEKGDDGSHPAGGGVPNAGPIDITAVTIG